MNNRQFSAHDWNTSIFITTWEVGLDNLIITSFFIFFTEGPRLPHFNGNNNSYCCCLTALKIVCLCLVILIVIICLLRSSVPLLNFFFFLVYYTYTRHLQSIFHPFPFPFVFHFQRIV